MRQLYRNFLAAIDADALLQRTVNLAGVAAAQTFAAYHAEAEQILADMKAAGLPNAEIVEFPADGKTAFEDKIMPLGWDASIGRLTLMDKERTVAADFAKQPLGLVKGSVSTRPGGEIMRIITQAQLLSGEDCRQALVMLNPETRPAHTAIKPLLDLGAKGFISDYLPSRYDSPDSTHWVNAGTEGNSWHVIDGDRPFIAFQVTPRMGDKIRRLAASGQLTALVESDGQRHVDTFPATTALLPGRRPEEFWIVAHSAEPFLDDDAAGIQAGIEIMKQMMAAGLHEYSLRILFTMEMYGFAAYHANFKGKVLGACNTDCLACPKHTIPTLTPPIPNKPFSGTQLLQQLYDELHDIVPMVPVAIPQCYDDMCLSDSTTGVPMVWVDMRAQSGYPHFWHDSCQQNVELLDKDIFASTTALVSTLTCKILNTPIPSTAPQVVITQKAPATAWRDYAAQQIYARATVGLPHDLAKVPRQFRRPLPDNVIYGPMGTILSEMDGKRNLEEIIQRTEAIKKITLSDEQIKKYLDAINYLADWGYLTPVKRTELTEEELTEALRKTGVRPGDLLLVHASTSKFGYIHDGAKTLIQAILAAIGPTGTALFTTFTSPYILLGGQASRGWSFKPFDASDISQIWTGEAGRTLLREFPLAIRSKHISHSWAGLGPLAKDILALHGATDAPCGKTSPLAIALQRKGKVLFAGTGLAPNTFLHYVETVYHSNYLGQAVCSVRNPDGSTRVVTIEQHLPGHRNFYGATGSNGKFYQKAFAAGLQVSNAHIGLAEMQLIDLEQLYAISSQLIQTDPNIFLCDAPNCLFCTTHTQHI